MKFFLSLLGCKNVPLTAMKTFYWLSCKNDLYFKSKWILLIVGVKEEI